MKLMQIYKCGTCGNMAEIVHASGRGLACCGKPMEALEELTSKEGKEKTHRPLIERTASGVRVKDREIPHAMEEAHLTEWIQLIADGKTFTRMLRPGDKSEAEFETEASNVKARSYCNLHGLWKSG